MTLKEINTLWGNPVIKLREYAKKYRVYSVMLYILDIILLAILTAIMYKQGSNFQVYMFVMVMFVLIFSLIFSTFLNTNKWSAFKFWKRYKNNKVVIKKYKVDAKQLYAVIYCMNYKRLKQDKEFTDYLDMILNACNEDSIYAKTVMKYLSKYEDEETGNLEVYTVKSGNKYLFIDYKNNNESEDN